MDSKLWQTILQPPADFFVDIVSDVETWHERLERAMTARGRKWPELIAATKLSKASVYAWGRITATDLDQTNQQAAFGRLFFVRSVRQAKLSLDI